VSEFRGFGAPRRRIELHTTALRCEIWPELGGAMSAFEALDGPDGPRALFRPTPAAASYMPVQLSSWPMLPYANRIRDGRFSYAGRAHRLPRNLPGFAHPLHGLGLLQSWQVMDVSNRDCTLGCHVDAGEAWPYGFRARQHFLLDEAGLCITLELQNTHERPMPYGLGQHPYIMRPPGTRIQAQVRGVWLTDAETLPIACTTLPREWDLPGGCNLGELDIDNCFVGFAGAARVLWPDGSALRLSASAAVAFLVIYSPIRQDFVCVEPVTQVPDCFNLAAAGHEDVGLRVLAPGQSAIVVHRFDFERDSDGRRNRHPLV